MTGDGPAPGSGAEAPSEAEADTASASPSGPPGAGPHTVLVTGAGGSGRTTVAAAGALAAARAGQRVLLLSTGEQGELEALLELPPPSAGVDAAAAGTFGAVQAAPGLWVARTAPDETFRALAATLQERGRSALELAGAEPLDEDEITALPGADAWALLRALRAAREDDTAGGPWDTVVVDLPAAPQALRLLALPEQLHRYLRRLLPPEKQAARALHPLLAQLAGVPMPAPRLYEAADRARRELDGARQALEAPGTSVRLVAEPGPLALEPLHTARAVLALLGLRLEAVVANRVLPTGSLDPWTAGLSGQQQSALKELRGAPAAPPVYEVPHLGRDPRGTADLAVLAERLPPPGTAPGTGTGPDDGTGPGPAGASGTGPVLGGIEDRLATEGLLHWRLPLPGARRETLELVRRGDELIVGVGPHRRLLPLPSALRRCRVSGAALEDGELRVRFTPDPGRWPRGAPAGG